MSFKSGRCSEEVSGEAVPTSPAFPYEGRGAVDLRDTTATANWTTAATVSIPTIGQMEAPEGRSAVQKSGVPYTSQDAAKIDTANAATSNTTTDTKNFRPMRL